MLFTKKYGTVLALAVACFFSAAAAGEEVDLAWKFKEGEVHCYKNTQTTSQEMMGMKMTNEQVQFLEWKVVKVDGDKADIEMKISRVKLKMSNPMAGDQAYDSMKENEKDKKDPNLSASRILVGRTFTLTMDNKGNVLGVKGYTQIGKDLLKVIEEQAGGNPQIAMMKKTMEDTFTDDFMRKTLDMSFTQFPEGSIETGKDWGEKAELSIPMFGNITTTITNKLDSVEGNMARVKFTGTMTFDPPGEEDPDNPMAAMMKNIKLKDGKVEGTLQFDLENEWVARKVQKILITMEIDMMGQKQIIPIVQEMVLERITPEAMKAE